MTEQPADDQGAPSPGTGEDAGREYRIGELARAAGVPVRTLRYYQERKLLPPPRRAGRIGLYSEDHLARLRMIGNLLERGHTLEGIRELLSAWEQGRDIGTVLGVEKVATAPWSTEVPVTMTLDELAALFPGEVGPESVERALSSGVIEVDGDLVTHWSRRQLEATVTLVRAGVPLAEVLSAGRRLQESMDELAEMFVRLITEHVVGDFEGQDLGDLTETLARLRPGAQVTVEAGFARAMDRQVRAAVDQLLGRLTSP
ncbi:MerR family transcriptional regulator [Actinomadura verrucosospora]|uniref:MerR-family transcriptional regulator n=1 Tax=Actinomadura verrucosospora TaxID=46165 RepID=A0A7D4A6P2_ACTVE|nr:MerR family transcriptional regulator [Actinomadura verrucosospora]QKG23845.1 merR-family transcriptional regulator [Actinomadura verrucosospora]